MPWSFSSSPSGSSSGTRPLPNRAFKRAEDGVEVGALLVLLVDEHQARDAQRLAAAPRGLGADLDPVDRADHDDRQVGDGERGIDLAREVAVARGVEDVDLVRGRFARRRILRLPLERRHRERQRHLALRLLGLGVAHRAALVRGAGPWDHARPEQQRFGDGRLAAPAVSDERDVSYAVGRRAVQRSASPGLVGLGAQAARRAPLPVSPER